MVAVVVALALVPWTQPLRFRPLEGWHAGASGTLASSYGPAPGIASPKESAAWMATGVAYRDPPTADPPDATLSRLPPRGIVVFAVAYQSGRSPAAPIDLRLSRARHFPCCDGTYVPGGEYGLTGSGPAGAYSVIVRVYFGSSPTPWMRRRAQLALDRLVLPPAR